MSNTILRETPTFSAKDSVSGKVAKLPFTATILLSAALIFLVQPLFAKLATPLLGGTPSVWNVSLVCFQAALLGGYAYAHALARYVPLKYQAFVHGAVLILAGLTLPIALSPALGQPHEGDPLLWLIGTFAISIAPAFIAISATSPLIQHWYGHSGNDDAKDPYFLYGASNIGSLIGLAAYPLVLEPLIGVSAQGWFWTVGYTAAAIGLVFCGLVVGLRAKGITDIVQQVAATDIPHKERWAQRGRWLFLAFLPSSLLVGTTSHIATDVASAPFLWSPPLILYIGSFIIAFSNREPVATKLSGVALPFAAGLVLVTTFAASWPTLLEIGIALGALAIAALYCHGTLAAARPPKERLTEFYFIMSLGGVLGGAFNAIIAPVIFSSVIEFPLILAVTMLALPGATVGFNARAKLLSMISIVSVGVGLVLWSISGGGGALTVIARLLMFVPVITLVLGRGSRSVAAIGVASLALAAAVAPFLGKTTLLTERSFFGVMRVSEAGKLRLLVHGTTVHGGQLIAETGRPTPLAYYHETTPIGDVFAAYQDRSPVGVVGLGVGAIACALSDDQSAVFYEIDPAVVRIARDPALFNFLSSCGANTEIITGDGRLTVAEAPSGTYGFMLLDAFSSDAVPAHLLTREALQMFMDRTAEDGVLAIHISNRHLDLAPIIARIAGAEGWTTIEKRLVRREDGLAVDAAPTRVVVLARHKEALAPLMAGSGWAEIESDGQRPWTDDFSNILGAWVANW